MCLGVSGAKMTVNANDGLPHKVSKSAVLFGEFMLYEFYKGISGSIWISSAFGAIFDV